MVLSPASRAGGSIHSHSPGFAPGASVFRPLRGLAGLGQEHFVGAAKAERFVERAALAGRVEGDDAQVAAARFGQAEPEEFASQAAAALVRLDEHIQDVRARLALRIQRMGRPVHDHQARRCNGLLVVEKNPAEILALSDHAGGPWFGGPLHRIEGGVVISAHGGEHGTPVAGDEGGIGRGRRTGFEHGVSIEGAAATYDSGMRSSAASLALDFSALTPGLRVAVGLSGGADSVALLRVLAERRRELGLVVHAAHLHHGLRGAEADADRDFCFDLAERLSLPFHEARLDTSSSAQPDSATGKAAETIEEAARRLRYGWFRELMASGVVDAVATAHTRDDQAETVLAKFLRGAWTEGLAGIHPIVGFPEGQILRPLLRTTRMEIEAYLGGQGQSWREDSSNRHLTFTRNRIRHELLPRLEEWNPRLREHLAQMAELAREEEAWWDGEVARVAGQIILPGRPVRGGGRAAAEGLAMEVVRLAEMPVALQRRVLRQAAERLGGALDFPGTEALRNLALTGRAGQKCELAGLAGERTHRELRLRGGGAGSEGAEAVHEYGIEIPGEVEAPEWGIRVRVVVSGARRDGRKARLRAWKAGDRVQLRYSGGPRKVKEVLERMHVTGSARATWPVVEVDGRIVWMQGVQAEVEPGIEVVVSPLGHSGC